MFNGTNLTPNSDLALVSTQVKTLLYLVGQKAEKLESFNMFNGTNLTLNSDLALVSTQVKTLLYLVEQKSKGIIQHKYVHL